MQLYKRGRVWWCWIRGQRVSTKCRDRKAAELAARELERAAADPRHAAAQSATLGRWIAAYLDDLARRGRSAATLSYARTKAGHFARLWGIDCRLVTVDAKRVAAYVATREGEGATPHTVVKELGALRGILRLARHHGEYAEHPSDVLPLGYAKRATPRSRWLPREEADRLLDELAAHRAAHVAFILATGARWGESVAARREDVDLERGLVLLRGTKTKAARRHVPVSPLTSELLALALLSAPGGPGGALFAPWLRGNYLRDLRGACTRAGIAPCSPNDFRRSYATWHRNAGLPPDLIAPLLGHTTSTLVETTYGRLTPEALGSLIRARLTVPDLYRDSTGEPRKLH